MENEIATLQDIDISPPENEAGDDFLFPDDLEDLDSDLENEFLEDSISVVSTPKPSLRSVNTSSKYYILRNFCILSG